MGTHFEQFVNQFTQIPLGLETNKVHQMIANSLSARVDSVITSVREAHHQKRELEDRPALPPHDRKSRFIDPHVFESNIAKVGFDANAWVKILRTESNTHNDQYHHEHASKAKPMQGWIFRSPMLSP